MDPKDKQILKLLKENSRYSVRTLAQKLDMRPATVHVRITKLVDKGIIRNFTIRTDDVALGEGFCVYVMAKGKLVPERDLIDLSCVKEVTAITGEYAWLLKLKFPHVQAFQGFLDDFRKTHPETTLLSMVATVTLKDTA